MTPERARLLEAVAEAAGHVANMAAAAPIEVRLGVLGATLSALRAYDAAPQGVGETVEVRADVFREHDQIVVREHGYMKLPHNMHIATITARVPMQVVPVISATVEEVKR